MLLNLHIYKYAYLCILWPILWYLLNCKYKYEKKPTQALSFVDFPLTVIRVIHRLFTDLYKLKIIQNTKLYI